MARNAVKSDEEVNSRSNFEIMARLFGYLKEFKLKVLIVILLMIFVMICNLINPYFFNVAIDKYIAKKNFNGLLVVGALMIALNFLSMFVSNLRFRIMASVTNKILVNIRHELYMHIQKLSFSFFDNRPVGKILARVIGDINSLQNLFNSSVTSLIPDLLTLICVTIIMFSINFRLAVAAIIVLPFLCITLFAVEVISRRRWQVFRKKNSNLNAYTHENFSGIRVIQSFAAEKHMAKSFSEFVKEMMGAFMNAVRLNDTFWSIVEISCGIGTVIVYWYGVKLIYSGKVTVGTLVAFTLYITMFWRPILDLSQFYNTLVTNFAAAERIFEILDIEPDIVSLDNAKKMPKINGSVEFKGVTFEYDCDSKVLDHINLKVRPGETIALVGPTGAGKTTIVNLISRFYDVNEGKVLIDGIDVRDVDVESLRSQMGIMLQDTFLFSATIMENIRYGKLDATDEEVIAAAKAVNAHDFIINFEDGYNTKVSERGSRLSVGQRQLISFARALLADPRILILDEATSNIDTYTEKIVQQGIEKLLHGRTSFVIAHRLSTIRNADRIMVISDGKIAEQGTHDELMNRRGRYYELYLAQYRFLSEGA